MCANVQHKMIDANGVRLHVAMTGDGPAVLLLHGFPENWLSWHRQIKPLAEAGFSVFAPDLRGYNRSDKPAGVRAYRLSHLTADVAALVRSTGRVRAHVVGHDWGGVIAWAFASAYPQLLDKLVILNAPHPRVYLREVWHPPQLLMSWYVFLFLLPLLPEWMLRAGNWRAVRRLFRHLPVGLNAFGDDLVEQYVGALSRPGALTAALNYYRANVDPAAYHIAAAPTRAHTLVLWGERDPFLSVRLLEGLEQVAPRVRVHRIVDVGHWVQHEAAEEVNRTLVSFLREERAPIVSTS